MTTLEIIAKKLSVNPAWLWALIQFESRADPAARNNISGARGLIQFMHATARDLGYLNADDLYKKNPTFDAQLIGPVYTYLKKYAPFPTKQSLYMAVFYPAARSWNPQSFFPSLVRKQNPGIDTVQDYLDHVEGKITKKTPALLALVALICGLIYFYSRKR
jgi:hypothetical protein